MTTKNVTGPIDSYVLSQIYRKATRLSLLTYHCCLLCVFLSMDLKNNNKSPKPLKNIIRHGISYIKTLSDPLIDNHYYTQYQLYQNSIR